MCNSNCSGHKGCTWSLIAKILLIVGGLNWGLVGIALLMGSGSNWNLVNLLLGSMPTVEGIVYVLVGISAVVKIFGCKCKKCMTGCAGCGTEDKGGSMDKTM